MTLEELKLEMQCKTDVKPHGPDGQVVLDAVRANPNPKPNPNPCPKHNPKPNLTDGQVVLDAVRAQLEEIAHVRDAGAVVRVFGARLLEALRQEMVDRTQVGTARTCLGPI